MSDASVLQGLDALPRRGWVKTPSPVSRLEALERHLGVGYLGVKRDDLIETEPGGTKVRKLDGMLAAAPWADAQTWTSAGAIGSGHMVALTAAAKALGRRVEAHCFWEPLSDGVLDNLAFVASGPTEIRFHRSRTSMALRSPGLVLPRFWSGPALVPPGASVPEGTVGLVRAAFELAEQVKRGELPEPDRIYVALGTGGTAAGLALGLGLAGLKSELHAVATVERVFRPRALLRHRLADLERWLLSRGIDVRGRAVPVAVDFRQIGRGYGRATAQSLAACELARGEGIDLEPIYTGKAMAALLADAAGLGAKKKPLRVLFWNTARRRPLAHSPGWRDRLPPELARRLDGATAGADLGRRVVIAGGAVAIAGVIAYRATGYPEVPSWAGQVLSAREALILAAAAEAVAPQRPKGPSPFAIAANVDRFLVSMPAPAVDEIHMLLNLVEQGTTPLGLFWSRFTRLGKEERVAFLEGLSARGGLLATAARGLRDLCFMGYYQDPSTWDELDYPGPWGPAATPYPPVPYDSFRATAGQLPRGGRS